MYSMKETCQKTGMTYENLKYYCNQGLIPHVKRDKHNHRIFDDHDIGWINSLVCLKKCGMTIHEMKQYLDLCLQGEKSIPQRQVILEHKKEQLLQQMQNIQESLDYIDWKQNFYQDVQSGKIAYISDLLPKN